MPSGEGSLASGLFLRTVCSPSARFTEAAVGQCTGNLAVRSWKSLSDLRSLTDGFLPEPSVASPS